MISISFPLLNYPFKDNTSYSDIKQLSLLNVNTCKLQSFNIYPWKQAAMYSYYSSVQHDQ